MAASGQESSAKSLENSAKGFPLQPKAAKILWSCAWNWNRNKTDDQNWSWSVLRGDHKLKFNFTSFRPESNFMPQFPMSLLISDVNYFWLLKEVNSLFAEWVPAKFLSFNRGRHQPSRNCARVIKTVVHPNSNTIACARTKKTRQKRSVKTLKNSTL